MSRIRNLRTLGVCLFVVIGVLMLAPGAWAAGKYKTLHTFKGGKGWIRPREKLIFDQGNLYSTTENGGDANDDGTVFELDQSGNETVLHRFNGTDGTRPNAGVIRDSAGNLYGTTYQGGAFGNGTVFKIAP